MKISKQSHDTAQKRLDQRIQLGGDRLRRDSDRERLTLLEYMVADHDENIKKNGEEIGKVREEISNVRLEIERIPRMLKNIRNVGIAFGCGLLITTLGIEKVVKILGKLLELTI